jgi:hypothetical protein
LRNVLITSYILSGNEVVILPCEIMVTQCDDRAQHALVTGGTNFMQVDGKKGKFVSVIN